MAQHFRDRAYWLAYLDCVIEELQNDKEKLVDVIMDRCMGMDIGIPIDVDRPPQYEICFTKSCFKSEKFI
jgi:hypothetical protein